MNGTALAGTALCILDYGRLDYIQRRLASSANQGQPDGRQVLPLRRPASRSFLPGKIYRIPSAATFACAAVQIAFTLSGSFSPNFNIFE